METTARCRTIRENKAELEANRTFFCAEHERFESENNDIKQLGQLCDNADISALTH